MNTQLTLFPETLPDTIARRLTGQPHIIFSGIDIRQDEIGRYCLNDLHKAAGGDNKKRPSLWLSNKRTQALIGEFLSRDFCSEINSDPSRNSCLVTSSEIALPFRSPDRLTKQEFLLGSEPVSVTKPKTGQPSTYVIKPLVYAYAAWVSPTFDLLVHEVFDAVISAHVEEMVRAGNALYKVRPRWKPIVEHPELKRAQLTKLTGHKSAGSITACRRRMREVGLIEPRAANAETARSTA